MHLALLAVLAPLAAPGSLCAQAPAEKPRLAIRAIAATPAVQAQAKSEGTDNALMQVEQGADPQLMDAIQATRRFDLVARSDMPSVMKEQDLTQSGNVNVIDPQAARAFQQLFIGIGRAYHAEHHGGAQRGDGEQGSHRDLERHRKLRKI